MALLIELFPWLVAGFGLAIGFTLWQGVQNGILGLLRRPPVPVARP
jgi:hypothetical protein